MKRSIIKALSLIVVIAMLMSATTVYAVEGTEPMNNASTLTIDRLPVTDYVSGVSPYDGTVTVLSESEASSLGVPAGFSGTVTRVGAGSNSSYVGVTIDPSALGIPVGEIEEMTLRVYLAGGGNSLRVSNRGASNWAILATVSSNAWVDYTVKSDGTGFNGTNFQYFKDANGNLGIFGIGAKNVSYLYVDSIRIVFADGYVYESEDETPPVLSYNGESELTFLEGDTFRVDGLTAFDEYDNASASISYEWSAGAVNAAGKLECGTHTCTVRATDRSGNSSTLELTVTVTPDPSLIRIENVPHIPHDITIANNAAYAGKAEELTAEQAIAKGLPIGYSGSVYEISSTNASYVGVCIDLSAYEIPINIVESVSFKVLMPTTYSELRMRNGNTTDWIMRCASAPTGSWTTVTLGADGLNFYGSAGMRTLTNDDGNLGAFALIGRVSSSYSPYYIDSIVIKLKNNDKTAPVLNYSGETDVVTSAEKVFAPDITAFDEQEGRYVGLSYEWSDGALDENGLMREGNHTCRVSASDYFGNVSYIDFSLAVGPKDVTPPEILFEASEIVVPVGTYCRMVIQCVDDYDSVDVVTEWSDGAIDFGGRLFEGVHTLTLTATDLTGNVTVHVVTVRVTSGDSTVGTLIQCGK